MSIQNLIKKFLKLKYTENSEKYSEKRRYTKQ